MTDQDTTKDTIVIHVVGNVSPRRTEYGEPVESLFALAHQRIKEADVSLCQLEMIFSAGRGCLQYRDQNTPEPMIHPENARALAFAGFNVMSHASNNCFDWGPDALLDSIDTVRKNGIQVVGAGKDIAEARKPAIVERRGIKVGVLAYSAVLPVECEAREGKPGCAPLRVSTYFEAQGYQPGTPPKVITIPREDDVRAMEEDIRTLRGHADVVIVSMHWGLSSIPTIVAYQPALAHRAIDARADLVVGHHGGTIKGIEMYRGRAIFYCLGNFALDRSPEVKPTGAATAQTAPASHHRRRATEPGWERNPGLRERRNTMVVRCVAGKTGLQKVSFLPCHTNQRAEPEVLSQNDPRFQEVLDYVAPQCRELGTTLSVEGDEVAVYSSTGERN